MSDTGKLSPNGAPFFWQPNLAYETIEEGLEDACAARAKLILTAFSRIVCKERISTVSKPVSYIAKLASLNSKTVSRGLPDLVRLGLIEIQKNELGLQNTYHIKCMEEAKEMHVAMKNKRASGGDLKSEGCDLKSEGGRTVNGPHGVPLNIEEENNRKRTISDRIYLKEKISILQKRKNELQVIANDSIERRKNPDVLNQIKEIENQIKDTEDKLIA